MTFFRYDWMTRTRHGSSAATSHYRCTDARTCAATPGAPSQIARLDRIAARRAGRLLLGHVDAGNSAGVAG